MAYNAEYQRPYEGGYVNKPDESTPEMAEFINARDDTLLKIEQFLANLDISGLGSDYALLSEAGYSLGLDINENYIMTISIKNKAGAILDSKSIDFPIESSIIDIDYADGNLILTLQNGNSVSVGISDIVRGLVPTTRKIAGIDLADDITKEELKDAIGIYDDVVSAGEIKPWLYIENEEVIVGTYNGKPLYRKTLPPISISVDRTMYALDVEYDSIMIDNSASFLVDNEGTTINTCSIGMIDDRTLIGDYTCNVFIINDKNICFRKGASITYTAYMTIQYTKTTDAEGSGNDLKPYGIYDAKLDEIKAEIDEVKNAITETTETTMPNSHEGRLLIKKIGGFQQEVKNSVVSGVKTHGKNFLNIGELNKTASGLSIITKENVITIKGTVEKATLLYVIGGHSETTTLFTLGIGTYSLSDGIRLVNYNGTDRNHCSGTFTLEEPFQVTGLQVMNPNSGAGSFNAGDLFDFSINAMLNEGDELLEFEPYKESYIALSQPIELSDSDKIINTESGFVLIIGETTEALPIADQIALNSLATYDGITYLEFVSEIKPTFKGEYGTSKHGGYTLESLLTARNNDLRLSSLEASVVNNI